MGSNQNRIVIDWHSLQRARAKKILCLTVFFVVSLLILLSPKREPLPPQVLAPLQEARVFKKRPKARAGFCETIHQIAEREPVHVDHHLTKFCQNPLGTQSR